MISAGEFRNGVTFEQDGPYLQLVCGLQAAQVRRAVDRELEQCAAV